MNLFTRTPRRAPLTIFNSTIGLFFHYLLLLLSLLAFLEPVCGITLSHTAPTKEDFGSWDIVKRLFSVTEEIRRLGPLAAQADADTMGKLKAVCAGMKKWSNRGDIFEEALPLCDEKRWEQVKRYKGEGAEKIFAAARGGRTMVQKVFRLAPKGEQTLYDTEIEKLEIDIGKLTGIYRTGLGTAKSEAAEVTPDSCRVLARGTYIPTRTASIVHPPHKDKFFKILHLVILRYLFQEGALPLDEHMRKYLELQMDSITVFRFYETAAYNLPAVSKKAKLARKILRPIAMDCLLAHWSPEHVETQAFSQSMGVVGCAVAEENGLFSTTKFKSAIREYCTHLKRNRFEWVPYNQIDYSVTEATRGHILREVLGKVTMAHAFFFMKPDIVRIADDAVLLAHFNVTAYPITHHKTRRIVAWTREWSRRSLRWGVGALAKEGYPLPHLLPPPMTKFRMENPRQVPNFTTFRDRFYAWRGFEIWAYKVGMGGVFHRKKEYPFFLQKAYSFLKHKLAPHFINPPVTADEGRQGLNCLRRFKRLSFDRFEKFHEEVDNSKYA